VQQQGALATRGGDQGLGWTVWVGRGAEYPAQVCKRVRGHLHSSTFVTRRERGDADAGRDGGCCPSAWAAGSALGALRRGGVALVATGFGGLHWCCLGPTAGPDARRVEFLFSWRATPDGVMVSGSGFKRDIAIFLQRERPVL